MHLKSAIILLCCTVRSALSIPVFPKLFFFAAPFQNLSQGRGPLICLIKNKVGTKKSKKQGSEKTISSKNKVGQIKDRSKLFVFLIS